jgi:glutaminyl-tRNA synthetase
MPTLKGLRNLGVPAEAIRNFCEMTGISKSDSITDLSLLEECIRDVYNQKATRAFGILSPLKVVITNYPEETEEELSIAKHPNEESFGKRIVPFSKYLYIDRDDFMEEPVGKFFRLTKGKEVRLRGAYVIKCDEVIKNEQGEITEIYCTYDKETLGKKPEGRKVKGVIHWLPFEQAKSCSVSLFDRLFTIEDPAKEENFLDYLNPNSKQEQKALVEPSLLDADIGDVFQFERVGYFILKSKAPLSFYRTVNLKDLWQKR